ncbi:MAG: FAD:protein FMN transferase, partial [Melioribacteraceae bacterium]|nr:FAD:protein FMN transferase [Melioribacteraceae bacterium]
ERSSFIVHLKICFLILVVLITSCSRDQNLILESMSGTTMGTTYSVKYVVDQGSFTSNSLQNRVDSILALINKQMSTYIRDSEISLFNSSFDTNWVSVSEDFARLVFEAKSISRLSNGYYDVTVGPVVNLWGFGPEAVPLKVPSEKSIQRAMNRTGIEKLLVDQDQNQIKKTIPDLYLDLSSIAKGFGVDKVAEYFDEIGINDFMVEIGGEVRTKGKNSKGDDWRIGISTPLGNELQKIVSISGKSVATSGDYMNYYENEGKRYSHLINPLTGKPITHNLASVTVIHDNCTLADAFATTINVMGTDKGYEFALIKKLPVFLIVREGNEFIEKMTPFFEEYIQKVN